MANAYRAYSDAASFLAAASPALLASPLFNQLPLALPTLSSSDPVRFPDVRLRTLHAPDGALRGAVVHTPPYAANLSLMAAEDAREMGRAYAAEFALPAGFSCVGEDAAARAFADGALDALQAMGRTARVEAEDRQGLWKLTAVAPPAPPPALGKMRPATADDAELLQRWLEAFTAEAVPHDPPPAPGRGAALAARGGARLWVLPDGTPVCFATFGRDVAGWVSVGPVYTPRERRGRGYAGALVAEMGREALKQGRPGCTLFTDLANPTSNGVYKRVGYEMVGTLTRFKVAVEDGKAEA
ncbi:acyl-CoA N-acyltransferase [Hyaloraphidium curvatum]|nr:acyl-CoA N-acyltransferase [Hyaloraphidium curvatum]